MKKLFKKTDGFTLLEMVLVIGILSVLSVITIAAMDPLAQFQKANDAKVKSDLAQVQRALESYYDDNGTYPPSSADYKIENVFVANNPAINWGASFTPYMNFLPVPPGSSKYVYYSQNGQAYFLYANLQRGANDPQVCRGGSACTNVPNGVTCGGVCNYGVSSPNVNL